MEKGLEKRARESRNSRNLRDVFSIILLFSSFGGIGPENGQTGILEFSTNEESLRNISFSSFQPRFCHGLAETGPNSPQNDKHSMTIESGVKKEVMKKKGECRRGGALVRLFHSCHSL